MNNKINIQSLINYLECQIANYKYKLLDNEHIKKLVFYEHKTKNVKDLPKSKQDVIKNIEEMKIVYKTTIENYESMLNIVKGGFLNVW